MAVTTKLVLDVLKPHQPSIVELAHVVAAKGAAEVEVNVIEMDELTETVTLTLRGSALDLDAIAAAIKDFGASVHSVDQVVVNAARSEHTC